MSKVVALKPHITEVAHNIAMKFAKADNVRARAHSIRVEIGFDLLDLQQRIASGEGRADGRPEEFWVWIKLYVDRSLRDMRKCIALAKAEDPEAAAEKEREDTRERMGRIRKERAHSAPPAQVVKFNVIDRAEEVMSQAIQLVNGMTEAEREQFVERLIKRIEKGGEDRVPLVIAVMHARTCGMTEGERKRLLARLWEEFPWLNVEQQRSN